MSLLNRVIYKDILSMCGNEDQCLPEMMVFTVSSQDYLSLVRPLQWMTPPMFDDVADTEIPGLRLSIVKQCQAAADSTMRE